MKRLKFFFFAFIITASIILNGCWDKVEIEDRAFVMAIGIDLFPESNKYVVTFQFPNAAQIAKGTSSGGGGSDKASFSVSIVADTIFSASRHLSTRLNKALYLGHTQAIILGKDVVENKEKFQEVLDSLDRSYELSRKLHLIVTPGKAQDIMLKDYTIEPNIGAYIQDVFKQSRRTSLFPNLDYNKIIKSIHDTDGNSIIPKIISGKDELRISGSAIIKNYKLAGWLDNEENMGYMWLTGNVKGGDVTFEMPGDGEDIKVPFDIFNVVTSKRVEEHNGKIKYIVKIVTEGDITEYTFGKHGQMMNTKILNIMEKKTEDKIKMMIKKAADKFQKDAKVDMLGIGDYLEKYQPNLWDKYKDNWNEVFQDVEIKAEVSAHIRRIGLFR
ncbi:MAG: Ger(x)C family spore germination protein [Thermoanaerobacteraceae bacterium]